MSAARALAPRPCATANGVVWTTEGRWPSEQTPATSTSQNGPRRSAYEVHLALEEKKERAKRSMMSQESTADVPPPKYVFSIQIFTWEFHSHENSLFAHSDCCCHTRKPHKTDPARTVATTSRGKKKTANSARDVSNKLLYYMLYLTLL